MSPPFGLARRCAQLRGLPAGLLVGVLACPGLARAAPARKGGEVFVIPAQREPDARELLAKVVADTPAPLRWQGPRIDIDRIRWWLMDGEQVRAMVLLSPVTLAAAAPASEVRARSKSFAIATSWAPGVEPGADERALLDAAVAAIVANDAGGFYSVAVDNLYAGVIDEDEVDGGAGAEPQDEEPLHYELGAAPGPDAVWRSWGRGLGGSALLVLLAIGVTLRREVDLQ